MLVFLVIFVLLLCCHEVAQAQPNIVCPRVSSSAVDTSTRLDIADPNKAHFTEISGLGFSPSLVGPSKKPLIYLMNDGGGGRRFGIYDSGTGERILSLRMPRDLAFNLDYESMSVGTCGIDEESLSCIYIADVGDNTARNSGGTTTGLFGHNRTSYAIYKIREPDPDLFEDNDILPDWYVTTLSFNYFHSSSPTRYSDCETMFLDNVGWGSEGARGDLYLVTKWSSRSTNTRLFKIPASVWRDAETDADFVYSPEALGDYSNGLNSNGISGHRWTRGEMTPDGTVIALGDFYDQYLYLRCPGMSVADVLASKGATHCESWEIAYRDSQFETLAWAPDGKATLEISECTSSYCNSYGGMLPMVFTEMDYTYYPGTSAYCQTFPTEAPSLLPSSLPTSSAMPSVSTAPSAAPTVTPPCLPVLKGTEKLFADHGPSYLCSPNGMYRFGFNNNSGELSLWQLDGSDTKIWTAKACCPATNVYLMMQLSDANLVLHGTVNGFEGEAIWASGTANFDHRGARLILSNDGIAKIRFNGTTLWTTKDGVTGLTVPTPTPQPTLAPISTTPGSDASATTTVAQAISPTVPAPTPGLSCRDITEKETCKDQGCKWKGGECIPKNQMRLR